MKSELIHQFSVTALTRYISTKYTGKSCASQAKVLRQSFWEFPFHDVKEACKQHCSINIGFRLKPLEAMPPCATTYKLGGKGRK